MSEVPVLSEREAELAQYAANGLTNSEIGALRSIDPETVKVHLKRTFKKLGITRRVHLLHTFPPQRTYEGVVPEAKEDLDILDKIAAGLTNAEIAKLTGYTVGTVHAIILRLRKETNINSRSEMAMWWMVKNGTVVPSENPMPSDQKAVLKARTKKTKKESLVDA